MSQPQEIEMESDRKWQPEIGTEILDNNMPSELDFKKPPNPEEGLHWKN